MLALEALSVILCHFSVCSRILGASSLLLVFSYPLMKRFTFWVCIVHTEVENMIFLLTGVTA